MPTMVLASIKNGRVRLIATFTQPQEDQDPTIVNLRLDADDPKDRARAFIYASQGGGHQELRRGDRRDLAENAQSLQLSSQ